MRTYYDKLVDYWESGELEEALRYFEEWKAAGLLDQEEIEKLDALLPDWTQVVSEKAHERLLSEKGKFTEEEFLEMVRVVDREMRAKLRLKNRTELWIKA